ncbi:hypothetical protein BJX66DRAFT_337765 [Aspergillus keveii]|uniref:DUF7703 domain-containing protein n=1 Tax=Aspergillus keveii TaxID=714993 RepID=A0ABR4G6J6_9EURO
MSVNEVPERPGPTDKIFLASAILLSIASYNVAEVLVWILSIFRHFRGLYFYSCLITNLSLGGFIALAFIALFTGGSATWLLVLWALVYGTLSTAQILVLYARIHLVCPHSPRVVRAVRLVVIITSVLLLPPLVICYVYTSQTPSFVTTDSIIQRGILLAFTVREIAVCVVYIVQAIKELGTIAAHKGQAGKRVMQQVIAVQSVVTLLDVALIAITWSTPLSIQWGITAVFYVVKLKMEFAILNALKTLSRSPTKLLPSSRSTGLQPSP